MANDQKQVQVALARAVAARRVPDASIAQAAEVIAQIKPEIRKIDICIYGICLDYWLTMDDLRRDIQDIVAVDRARIGDVRIFKYGIIDPDLFHVQAELDIEGLGAGIPNVPGLPG